MKSLLSLIALAAGSAGVVAQNLPSAGLWDLSLTMEGAPRGGGSHSAKACLTAEALAVAPEQALIETAARHGGNGRAAPKCEYRDVKRDGTSTSWQSSCEGPMGPMQGSGTGTLGAEAAQLIQTFNVKAPIGALTLKQTVSARRVGSC